MAKKKCCDIPDVYKIRQGTQVYTYCSKCKRLLDELNSKGKKVIKSKARARIHRQFLRDEKKGNRHGKTRGLG